MTFDTGEIAREVQQQAVRHEMLAGRLSRVVGSIPDYHEKTLAELALYGLNKLGIEPPADEEPCIVALEYFLRGRSNSELRGGTGMDSAGDSFVDRYINSQREGV